MTFSLNHFVDFSFKNPSTLEFSDLTAPPHPSALTYLFSPGPHSLKEREIKALRAILDRRPNYSYLSAFEVGARWGQQH